MDSTGVSDPNVFLRDRGHNSPELFSHDLTFHTGVDEASTRQQARLQTLMRAMGATPKELAEQAPPLPDDEGGKVASTADAGDSAGVESNAGKLHSMTQEKCDFRRN